MEQYLELLNKILKEGKKRPNRTWTDTLALFGCQMKFNLNEGFPLLTTRKIYFKGIIYELLWFIKGETNIKYLVDHGVNIWNEWPFEKYKEKALENPRIRIVKKSSTYFLRINKLLQVEKKLFKKLARKPFINEIAKELRESEEWILDTDRLHLKMFVEKIKKEEFFAKKFGNLGPVYGKQWRNFGGVDQLKELVESLKNNPFSRRHILTSWNPPEINEALLPPCHVLAQFFVSTDMKLSCLLYQRSGDMFLGVPFNIASYSLLTAMMAQVCGYQVGEFIHNIGDTHIYLNHIEAVEKQLKREPRKLPNMKLNPKIKSLFDFSFEDISLENYEPYPPIKAKVAI